MNTFIKNETRLTSLSISVWLTPFVSWALSMRSRTVTSCPSMYSKPVTNASLMAYCICRLMRPVASGQRVMYRKSCFESLMPSLSVLTLTWKPCTLKTEERSCFEDTTRWITAFERALNILKKYNGVNIRLILRLREERLRDLNRSSSGCPSSYDSKMQHFSYQLAFDVGWASYGDHSHGW